MPDMLVPLYALPDYRAVVARLATEGIDVRRAVPPEKHRVLAWIGSHFSPGWVSECDRAFANSPCSCFIAVEAGRCIGFACYDATCRDYFGPTGVAESHRGRGIGTALLWATLDAMWAVGYAYAIVGGAGPTEFYARTVGAIAIDGSAPGIYRNMVKEEES